MNYSQQQQHPWKLTYSAVSGRNSWSSRKIQNGMSNKQHDWLINCCLHCSSSSSRWSLHKDVHARAMSKQTVIKVLDFSRRLI